MPERHPSHPVDRRSPVELRCLLVSPADPLTGRPRAGPLRRYRYPPPGVEYTHVTDRFAIPAGTGRYNLSPVNVGLAAVKFAMEHAFPLDLGGASLVHTFFWDVRKFTIPWVHESDQSLGQYLAGYNNIGGFVQKRITEGYSSYLNSRGCLGVVTWTEWAKSGFVADGVDRSKVFVIPPPFMVSRGRSPHPGCNILFIGRDFQRKGGDLVLSAFRNFDSPGCRLTYVGAVDARTRREIEADRRITYYSTPTNETLSAKIWPEADIFVLPTRADAFAMTVAEAMSRGIPVVTSSIPPIREMVDEGASGLLVPVGDQGALTAALQRLVGDASIRKRMGEAAAERVKTLFSPDKLARKLMEVYRRG